MFIPEHFRVEDEKAIFEIIDAYPFSTLVSRSADTIVANHIPLIRNNAKAELVLFGHMANANPHMQQIKNGEEQLCIFQGPHNYISPRAYCNPGVPTWNFVSIHCYGVPRLITSDKQAAKLLDKMVSYFEATNWDATHLTEEHYAKSLSAIQHFEIKIDRLEAEFKLSQNKESDDQWGVLEYLNTPKENSTPTLLELVKTHCRIAGFIGK